MLLNNYDVDPQYFSEKYNIKIIGKKETPATAFRLGDDRFFV